MVSGLVGSQLNEIEYIFKKLNLLDARENFPRYSSRPAHEFKSLSYRNMWELCYTHRYYHFIFKDLSLLQYRVTGENAEELSYSFLECPIQIISYSEFVESKLGISATEVGDLFREEYELELSSAPIKESVTPIRYDYDPKRYEEGSHPASHIHFGVQNDIRVGTANLLTPLSFALFILRQHYRLAWQNFCHMDEAKNWSRFVRDKLRPIDKDYRKFLDDWEMSLK